ncbi:MAG: hypothetical protein RI897_4231 [Verrucomicrobiota bacterium]
MARCAAGGSSEAYAKRPGMLGGELWTAAGWFPASGAMAESKQGSGGRHAFFAGANWRDFCLRLWF